jgi:hypothetical protein
VFPNRVGKVILDGVVDPWLWAARPFLEVGAVLPRFSCIAWTHHVVRQIGPVSLNSTDATFDAFALNCANAGSSKCAIATNSSNVDSIRAWTFDLIAVRFQIARRLYM